MTIGDVTVSIAIISRTFVNDLANVRQHHVRGFAVENKSVL